MKRIFWLSFLLGLAVYAAMLTVTLPTLMEMAGGLAPFDMRPMGYSEAEAVELLAALGPEGRAYYGDVQHLLDLVFPGAMAVALISGGMLLIPRPWFWIFVVLVIVAKGADYMENAAVASMLSHGIFPEVAARASMFTLVKSLGDMIVYSWFLLAALLAGWRNLRRGRTAR